jgi:hypothetical protein
MNWKPFNGCFGDNEYFLIRQIGNHPATGKKLVPIVAQLIDGDLYSIDNEIEPVVFTGHLPNGDICPEYNPFKANLEWMPIPE